MLAGLNLHEVANEASISRGMINYYFGGRTALLRAAIESGAERSKPEFDRWRGRSPEQKRRRHFRDLVRGQFARLTAVLAIEGDEAFEPIAFARERIDDLRREQAEGVFAADVDVVAVLALWDATLLGYTLIRNGASRQLGTPERELDRRILAFLERQVAALESASPVAP